MNGSDWAAGVLPVNIDSFECAGHTDEDDLPGLVPLSTTVNTSAADVSNSGLVSR